MTAAVRRLLDTFDALPDEDKQEAAAEIRRRTIALTPAEMPEEALVEAADELFRELDAREAAD